MEAEYARLKGDLNLATQSYDEAIREALSTRQFEYAGLACERCLDLWLKEGREKTAQHYLKEALRIYTVWGALGKVKFLQEYYIALLEKRQE